MPEGICKLTGTYGKFVKSHIYPRSFCEPEAGERLAVVPLSSSGPAQRSQTGIYDQNIVGLEGERILAKLDAYAHNTLIRNRNAFTVPWFSDGWALEENGRPICYEIIGADPVQLKKFILSILWRCAVSTRKEYESVQIGKHEEALRQIISGEPHEMDDRFSTIISRLSDVLGLAITPYRPQIDGSRYWQMIFSDLCFTIDLDGALSQQNLDELTLKPGRRVYILNTELRAMKFGRQTIQKLRQHQAAYGDPWGRDCR